MPDSKQKERVVKKAIVVLFILVAVVSVGLAIDQSTTSDAHPYLPMIIKPDCCAIRASRVIGTTVPSLIVGYSIPGGIL